MIIFSFIFSTSRMIFSIIFFYLFVGNMREQYVQIGNAVPLLLSYAIAEQIKKAVLTAEH